jgi:tRNA/rRNA methyltransferase
LLTPQQRDRVSVVLVSPRNPLNIGAVARAMANFGFSHLTVVAPYEPHWREARSAIGAPELLANAREVATLAEAVRECTFVLGTGTVTHRRPEQPVIRLDQIASRLNSEVDSSGAIALIFGPEKHGLTREDLSFCHYLVEIPTDSRQPSMNLGQAAAVCFYELAIRAGAAVDDVARAAGTTGPRPTSSNLDALADLIQQVMLAANYSPANMQAANQHDLRLILRRLQFSPADQRRALGLFRRILRRLSQRQS